MTRYNRIDLFAPAGVTYANGSSSQVPFFSLSPISFNSPEAFLPRDPASVNFRNVQSLVEAINTGSTPMPKSSALVANGLTLIAEAELKALSLLANLWPSRHVSRVTAAVNGSSHTVQLLASASVFAVAVRSAVSFEFPGQKLDGVAAARSEATHYSPAFASSLSNMNTLSLIWSHSSSSVVASVPLAFPTRHSTRLSPRRCGGVIFLCCICSVSLRHNHFEFQIVCCVYVMFFFQPCCGSFTTVSQRNGRICRCRPCHSNSSH